MSISEQPGGYRPTISARRGRAPGLVWLGACIGAFWLIICLPGCQPKANKAPALAPPPAAKAAARPQALRPTFYVTVGQLRVRACPGLDCPKTTTLELNTAVEKLGEIEKWTQIKVKKDGTLGYVSSRYLSPHPVELAKRSRKKPAKAKHHQANKPDDVAKEGGGAAPHKQESAPSFPKVM